MQYNKINKIIDFFIFIFSLYISLWLRFNGEISEPYYTIFFKTCIIISIFKLLIFILTGNYKIILNHYGTYDVIISIKSTFISSVLFGIAIHIINNEHFLYPRSVIIIDFILTFVLVNGVRYIEKYFLKERISGSKKIKYLNTLIIGAGEAGSMVLREIRNNPSSGMKVIGFIDDDETKKNLRLSGKKIFGNRYAIPDIVNKYSVKIIIIALPSAKRSDINNILKICEKTKAKIKIVPSSMDIIKGVVTLNQIRDIKIEDLLNREEIKLDIKSVKHLIKNRRVLITGAGGSIGSEISRQVASFNPSEIVLLGKGENSIFNINMELINKYKKIKISPVIADIRNKEKIDKVFKQYKPEIVFHAAAHKHVFFMELFPDEAFENNVLGTLNVAEASIKYKVAKFVMISTDKAVNPTSVMGATKRIAEKIVIGLNDKKGSKTKFVAVRFGNVLGSRGSVVPIFKSQIQAGGPVTVTHPDVTRYFMTIPEAVQLVLQAASIGKGGEVFILDMGEPVKIVDLARRMIILSGYEPDRDIKIKFIGLKPGEKLFEELVLNKTTANTTKYDKIFIDKTKKVSFSNLITQVNKIQKALRKNTVKQIKKNILTLAKK